MLPLLFRYRWWAAAYIALHPIVYLLVLILPISVMGPLAVLLVLSAIVLAAVWLVAVIFEL